MTRFLSALLLCLALAGLGACSGDDDACPDGSEGCACVEGSCDGDLLCGLDQICKASCELGAEGCSCIDGTSCAANSDGDPLSCVDGLCAVCEGSAEECATNNGSGCTPGNIGCDCIDDVECNDGLACVEDLCQQPDCRAGLEGCACLGGVDGECGTNSDGESLECNAGICESARCAPGETGCVCREGVSCDDSGASCAEGYCKLVDCIPGQQHCDCLAGSCEPGLTCAGDTICRDNTGYAGGECFSDNTCARGFRCDDSVAPATCVRCSLGTQGCQCQDTEVEAEKCNRGLSCTRDHCVGDDTVHNRSIPADPTCYTSCNANIIEDDGTVRVCDSEGQMEGCLGDLECKQGSCTPPDSEPAVCYGDGDCTDYQVCIQGYCYSNCDNDAACDAGMECHQKTCRPPCTSQDDCSATTTCDLVDGTSGYCMPAGPATSQAYVLQEGTFAVETDLVELSNVRTTAEIKLFNTSDQFLTVTLRKSAHHLVKGDGTTETVRGVENDACTLTDCPMWWLEYGEAGNIDASMEKQVRVPPRCASNDTCPSISLSMQPVDAVRWRGSVIVQSTLGSDQIDVTYVERPEGRWSGRIVYFADFNDAGIDTTTVGRGWLDRDRDFVLAPSGSSSDLDVENGLLQVWGAMRNRNLSGGWNAFKAVLTATESGQWKWASVQDDCRGDACYLYDDGASVGALPKVYVTSLDSAPIPEGVTEFPIAMNLYTPDPSNPAALEGRVVSQSALHYPGNPKVTMNFEEDPSASPNCLNGVCTSFLKTSTASGGPEGLDIALSVGGRYLKPQGDTCAPGFVEMERPWLVPGFLTDAYRDATSGLYRKAWCVDYRLPSYTDPVTDILPEIQVDNRSLARSNPIPDGRVLERDIELLDGAMINQQEMIIFFRERYTSILSTQAPLAYGYMLLQRQPAELDLEDNDTNGVPDAYDGTVPPSGLDTQALTEGGSCSEDILDEVLGAGVPLSAGNAATVVDALIYGGQPAATGAIEYPVANADLSCSGSNQTEVHYVCVDTGLFDGGANNTSCWGAGDAGPNDDSCATALDGQCQDGGMGSVDSTCNLGSDVTDCGWRYNDARMPCPETSDVVFFTAPTSEHNRIAMHSCQDTGTCMSVLNNWVQNGTVVTALDPVWTCANDAFGCDENTLDRRDGKVFYKPNAQDVYFNALRPSIDDAFRYKTDFQNRSGSNVGFTPTICQPHSTTTPYCYSPDKITDVRERIDCLLAIYKDYYSRDTDPENQELFDYLEQNFSLLEIPSASGGLPDQQEGFERLFAELLIMLGDDAFTSAFESRFDLAGSNIAGFQGDLFEDNGLPLSGITGYEMYKLHQAVQYYSMVLDRFYQLTPVVSAALEHDLNTSRNIMSAATVTTYLQRLIRASSQRSRVWAEIARRYQSFNAPDLARRVALRAYTATYLESVALASAFRGLKNTTSGNESVEIGSELQTAQRSYRMALLDLAEVYKSISDEVNFFGFSPDYIPFPALDTTSGVNANAFEKVYTVALSKLDVARQREQQALSMTREFDTDEASFQSELVQISRTYENQLADICGLFTAADGRVYPAIGQYAFLDDQLSALGNPCGLIGNGQITQAVGQVESARFELRKIVTQMNNIYERINNQVDRVNTMCQISMDIADFQYQQGLETIDLETDMARAQEGIELAQRVSQAIQSSTETAVSGTFGSGLAAVYTIVAATEAELLATAALNNVIEDKREAKAKLELDTAKWVTEKDCDKLDAELNFETANMMLDLREMEIALLQTQQQLGLHASEVAKLRQQAQRIELEMQEAVEMSINVQAAKNDPNVRIYQNDSVINADIAFEDALREAYRLTLVYQYYTSQTYAKIDELFLTRMISFGTYNLENYVYELHNAFVEFQEEYGTPDVRLLTVSLRDDVFRVPRTADDGTDLNSDARSAMFRDKFNDQKWLDKNGYITIPFSTKLQELSPLTRNHKIMYVEANLAGSELGHDFLARVYLRQAGTSTIATVDDDQVFYRFPERTAVINPMLNGSKKYSENLELYRNYRLRDRPLVNNNWEMVLNLRDEFVNQDIDPTQLTDIKFFIYYNDFTAF